MKPRLGYDSKHAKAVAEAISHRFDPKEAHGADPDEIETIEYLRDNLEGVIKRELKARNTYYPKKYSLGLFIFNAAALVAMILSSLILLFGFSKLLIWGGGAFFPGLGDYWKSLEWLGLAEKTFDSDPIVYCIHGVELLLLAPIPFFVVRVYALYMSDFKNVGFATERTKRSLIHVKGLIAGLISGIIMASLAGDSLQGFEKATTTTHLILIGLKILSLAVISLFYFRMEYIQQGLEKEDVGADNP